MYFTDEPKFIEKPKDVSGEEGEEVNLVCLTDGNPSPSYRWFRNKDLNTVVSYSSNLTIMISQVTAGTYTCRVSVAGYKSVQSNAKVWLRGAPNIAAPGDLKIYYGSLGSTVELVCKVVSMPPTRTPMWIYNNYQIANTNHYNIARKKLAPDTLVTSLMIRELSEYDFGPYNCSARNQYGQDSLLLELRQEGMYVTKNTSD